jgi:hypothetical protein
MRRERARGLLIPRDIPSTPAYDFAGRCNDRAWSRELDGREILMGSVVGGVAPLESLACANGLEKDDVRFDMNDGVREF